MRQRFPGVDGGTSSGLGIDFGAHAFGGSNVEMTQTIEEKNFSSILGYVQSAKNLKKLELLEVDA